METEVGTPAARGTGQGCGRVGSAAAYLDLQQHLASEKHPWSSRSLVVVPVTLDVGNKSLETLFASFR
jgi:hypothetical protein